MTTSRFENPHQQAAFAVVFRDGAVLGQAGMQEHRMRHHRRADDADGDQQSALVGQARRHQSDGRAAPVDGRQKQFDQITKTYNGNHGADDHFHEAEAAALEQENAVGHDRGDRHALEQRNAGEQRQADGAAEKFGEIGRHGGEFANGPHHPDQRARIGLAAHLGKVASGHDPELGRHRLEQHRDQIGQKHHPKQRIAVFRPGLDVGGEIARVHIGDRRDYRRTEERQYCADSAAPARHHFADREFGPPRQAFLHCNVSHFVPSKVQDSRSI